MLKKAGIDYVICGHSEARALGDTNETVNKKIREAFLWRLIPILCVGERNRDEDGRYLEFIEEEIKTALFKVPKKLFTNLIVAYEPVWAIGENAQQASTPEDFLEKSIFIRKIITSLSDKETAMRVPILYGGSVDEHNAFGFLSEGKGDGLLVGRASLDAESFGEILSIAESL
jgi:triosephosphate isomerase